MEPLKQFPQPRCEEGIGDLGAAGGRGGGTYGGLGRREKQPFGISLTPTAGVGGYYTILYYTILYYTILYYTILYYTKRGSYPHRKNTGSVCSAPGAATAGSFRLAAAPPLCCCVDRCVVQTPGAERGGPLKWSTWEFDGLLGIFVCSTWDF